MAKTVDKNYCFGFFKSKALKSAVARVPARLWNVRDDELLTMFNPTKVEIQIKCRLWNLISVAPDARNKFKLRRLYDDVCSYSNLFNNILSRPEKVVWLLRPDPVTLEAVRAAQSEALERLKEITSASVFRKSGEINSVAAKRLIETVELLFAVEARVKNR